jgi:hypothetical protein
MGLLVVIGVALKEYCPLTAREFIMIGAGIAQPARGTDTCRTT